LHALRDTACSVLFCLVSDILPYLVRLVSFTDPAPPEIYTLSLHDALPISLKKGFPQFFRQHLYRQARIRHVVIPEHVFHMTTWRSEEHTSELQSRFDLVCRLLLEKKKKRNITVPISSDKRSYNLDTLVHTF